MTLPPLRERRSDIAPLAHHLVQRFAKQQGKVIETIPEVVMASLEQHGWPGNIRELQNVIERGVIMTTGPILARQTTAHLTPIAVGSGSIKTLAEAERAHITATLRETNWVVGGPRGAASQLGMPRTSLISRMQRLGISGRASRCRPARTTQRLVRVIGGLSSRLKDDSTTGVHVLEAASSQIKENQR
jgi:formate hydrogenlyase transcriptional activator